MKKLILILMVDSLFMGCAFKDSKNISEFDLLHKTNPDGNYGNEITLEVKHQIGKLLGTPQTYLGEEVLVSGEITEVCPMRGCWIDVKDLDTGSSIRIKVTDGKIVFPLSAKANLWIFKGNLQNWNLLKCRQEIGKSI